MWSSLISPKPKLTFSGDGWVDVASCTDFFLNKDLMLKMTKRVPIGVHPRQWSRLDGTFRWQPSLQPLDVLPARHDGVVHGSASLWLERATRESSCDECSSSSTRTFEREPYPKPVKQHHPDWFNPEGVLMHRTLIYLLDDIDNLRSVLYYFKSTQSQYRLQHQLLRELVERLSSDSTKKTMFKFEN